MSKKTDKIILDMLKDRVLERDKELEKLEYHSATKEALAELTSLSQNEVDAIYRQVKAEVEMRQKKQQKRILWTLALFVIISIPVFFIVREQWRDPLSFTDNFTDNSSAWSFEDITGAGRLIENGEYVIRSKEEKGDIDYIDHEIALPRNYSVQADTRRIGGEEESYGIYIGEDANNFGYFFIRPNGKFRRGFCINAQWQNNPDWKFDESVKTGKNAKNRLKVDVKGNNYTFYINYKEAAKGNMFDLSCTQYSLAVGGAQTVAFDSLVLLNTDTNDTLYFNDFQRSEAPWTEKSDEICKAEFAEEGYRIQVNNQGYCYWAQTWIPVDFQDDAPDFAIQIIAQITESKPEATFGFMWMRDDENFMAFEVKDGERARIVVNVDGEYEYIGNYSPAFKNETDDLKLEIRSEGDEIEYYFNGQLIDRLKKDYWLYSSDLDRMGLRVCDVQTVLFKSLRFEEIK